MSLSHKLGLTAAVDVALERNTVRSCLDGLFTHHKERVFFLPLALCWGSCVHKADL